MAQNTNDSQLNVKIPKSTNINQYTPSPLARLCGDAEIASAGKKSIAILGGPMTSEQVERQAHYDAQQNKKKLTKGVLLLNNTIRRLSLPLNVFNSQNTHTKLSLNGMILSDHKKGSKSKSTDSVFNSIKQNEKVRPSTINNKHFSNLVGNNKEIMIAVAKSQEQSPLEIYCKDIVDTTLTKVQHKLSNYHIQDKSIIIASFYKSQDEFRDIAKKDEASNATKKLQQDGIDVKTTIKFPEERPPIEATTMSLENKGGNIMPEYKEIISDQSGFLPSIVNLSNTTDTITSSTAIQRRTGDSNATSKVNKNNSSNHLLGPAEDHDLDSIVSSSTHRKNSTKKQEENIMIPRPPCKDALLIKRNSSYFNTTTTSPNKDNRKLSPSKSGSP